MVCLAAFLLNILLLTRVEANLSNSWTVKRIMMIVFDEKTLCPDPGWSGENCDEPVCTEECVHGYCIEPDICSCDSWYVGDLCQYEWKHADCINGVGPTCECIEGWQGETCTEPICKDGCHPIFGSCEKPGECTCTHDSMGGDLCKECTPAPECLHGTCEGPGDCICNPGWTGYYCDTPICSPGCHPDRGYCRYTEVKTFDVVNPGIKSIALVVRKPKIISFESRGGKQAVMCLRLVHFLVAFCLYFLSGSKFGIMQYRKKKDQKRSKPRRKRTYANDRFWIVSPDIAKFNQTKLRNNPGFKPLE
ncbi:protein delta homolog 1 [Eurytemora carolleeae]|uniref:protein delta homolog 1 n=1 Tax=Eurytemora carolleeae TaxID=1294199 RepID=UPI000C77BFFC|nr:protein delta homolog 1 [Eurytemora carolleeae]|eukprot:XP_023343026.1 protein delta homolog 1-like [Eurytemora affinis]